MLVSNNHSCTRTAAPDAASFSLAVPLAYLLFCALIIFLGFFEPVLIFSDRFVWMTRVGENNTIAMHAHAFIALACLVLLTLQPILGYFGVTGNKAAILLIHRLFGRIIVVSLIITSVVGVFIAVEGYFIGLYALPGTVFLLINALLITAYYALAVYYARLGRLDRHVDSVIFATIWMSVPAFARVMIGLMKIAGLPDVALQPKLELWSGAFISMDSILSIGAALFISLTWISYALIRRVVFSNILKLILSSLILVLALISIAGDIVAAGYGIGRYVCPCGGSMLA